MALQEARRFEVALDFSVKTYDIDFAGVVSNIVYIRWLEDLRLAWFEAYYPLEKVLDVGYDPTLAETRIQYRRAIRLGDRPCGRMWMQKVKRLKGIVAAEISVDGKIAAVSEQTICLVERSRGRPVPFPEDLYTMLSRSI